MVIGCDKVFSKDHWRGARISSSVRNTAQWWLAVLSWVDDGQKFDGNTHSWWDGDQIGQEGGHDQAWERPRAGSPSVRKRKHQRKMKSQRQDELERWREWQGLGLQGQTLFILPYGTAEGLELLEHETRWTSHYEGKHRNRRKPQRWYHHHRQGSGRDDHYNRKLLGDRYQRKHCPFKGKLVRGLCLHLSQWWRSKKHHSVYGIHQEDHLRIPNFTCTVAGKAIGHGDVRLRFRLPGGLDSINEVVVRDALHVKGAHNSLSQSGLMDRGLQIFRVNGYGIKIYDNRGQGSPVAQAPQVGGVFRFKVDAGGKGRRSRELSGGRKRHTSPNTIPN